MLLFSFSFFSVVFCLLSPFLFLIITFNDCCIFIDMQLDSTYCLLKISIFLLSFFLPSLSLPPSAFVRHRRGERVERRSVKGNREDWDEEGADTLNFSSCCPACPLQRCRVCWCHRFCRPKEGRDCFERHRFLPLYLLLLPSLRLSACFNVFLEFNRR